MESEHDGEGGGGNQLLIVVVVQAMSSCQGKSVANLSGGYPAKTTKFHKNNHIETKYFINERRSY